MVQLTDPSEDITYLPDAGDRCIDIDQVTIIEILHYPAYLSQH